MFRQAASSSSSSKKILRQAASSSSSSSRVPSTRVQRQQCRVLDQSTRDRRIRRQLEQLEWTNFHDDPGETLAEDKRVPKFDELSSEEKKLLKKSDKKSKRHVLPKSKMPTLEVLIENDSNNRAPNYQTIQTKSLNAGPSQNRNTRLPNIDLPPVKRHFCDVCGMKGIYTCLVCGVRYCSLPCQQTHLETRCAK